MASRIRFRGLSPEVAITIMLAVSATTKPTKRAKRPAFDREQGVAVAQALFHARGYDAVGVAELTQALNILPPSLYAAYGSKVDLYERTLRRYAETTMLPLDQILTDDRSPAEALTELLDVFSLIERAKRRR